MTEYQLPLVDTFIGHIEKLIHSPTEPDLPAEAGENVQFHAVHDYLVSLRSILDAFAKGDLSRDIKLRGVLAGRLKALQANLLHLTWQIQQVADGDFTQRVEFMGDYSVAFNSMVVQLDNALTALRHKEKELTRLTEALQTEVAEKVEALAALSKSQARFKHMAEHDALTGVLNRRSFHALAMKEFKRAEKEHVPCSMALVDVDFFKNLNDTYGHLEGDAALRLLTKTMEASLRHGGIIGRYGGEEFVVLLSGLDFATARKVAERLRMAVAKTPLRTPTGPVPMTISIGLAHVPPIHSRSQDPTFLESVISVADEALYAAKEAGRNRLVAAIYTAEHTPAVCGE